jgi:hypothetical protein
MVLRTTDSISGEDTAAIGQSYRSGIPKVDETTTDAREPVDPLIEWSLPCEAKSKPASK